MFEHIIWLAIFMERSYNLTNCKRGWVMTQNTECSHMFGLDMRVAC